MRVKSITPAMVLVTACASRTAPSARSNMTVRMRRFITSWTSESMMSERNRSRVRTAPVGSMTRNRPTEAPVSASSVTTSVRRSGVGATPASGVPGAGTASSGPSRPRIDSATTPGSTSPTMMIEAPPVA